MQRPLSATARALLDAATEPEARRFADAVVRQVAFPPGWQAAARFDGAGDARVAADLVRFLHAARRDESTWTDLSPPPSAELLSSIFQNVDLLYADEYAGADRVSLLLLSLAWDGGQSGGSKPPEPREER